MKKILSLIVTIVFILNLYTVYSYASGATVSIESKNAVPGQGLDVGISLQGCTGFSNISLEISYDSSVMTLKEIKPNNSVGATFVSSRYTTVNPYVVTWNSIDNVSFNGTLAVISFDVSDNAALGEYPVSVSCYKGEKGDYKDNISVNYDESFNGLNLSYTNGIINIISDFPTSVPTATPTVAPTATPTVKPTATPTAKPTATPTVKPTATPTAKPMATPTATPTVKPTATPTAKPTATPTVKPTATPTAKPTATPTVKPTATPTAKPTATPTVKPTATPTPTVKPTATPTAKPTETPTVKPTATPTAKPTATPTATPTAKPTATPTVKPTATPTAKPTATPTAKPTATPTAKPTAKPTVKPTATPTAKPTATPTAKPTATPTVKPTATPTAKPTATPTAKPTATPTAKPIATPTTQPKVNSIQVTDDSTTNNIKLNINLISANGTAQGMLLIARYDKNGHLIGAKIYNAEDCFDFCMETSRTFYDNKIGIVWWDGIKSMKPLANSVSITLQ